MSTDLLVVFMAFASNQNDVASSPRSDSPGDGGGAILNDALPAATSPRNDSSMICCGSSVRGLSCRDNDRSPRRSADARHQRPFARIALAAATEHAPKVAAAVRPQRTQARPSSAVGRVCVVDINCRARPRRRAACVPAGPAPATGHHMLPRAARLAEQQCEHERRIGNIEIAGQRQAKATVAP